VIDDNDSDASIAPNVTDVPVVTRKIDTTVAITTENAPIPCGKGLGEESKTRDNFANAVSHTASDKPDYFRHRALIHVHRALQALPRAIDVEVL
jgi:hypothetical protein